MKKNIFVSFVLTAALVFGAFVMPAPAQAEASTLWGMAQEQLGASASNSAIVSLTKQFAIRFGIAIPEWGIPGRVNANQIPKSLFQSILGQRVSAAPGIGCTVISFSPISLPDGTVGISYNNTISASGGTDPYTFGIMDGGLPMGTTINEMGAIFGIPQAAGTYFFTITATDSNGCVGSQAYSIIVTDSTPTPTPTLSIENIVTDLGFSPPQPIQGTCTPVLNPGDVWVRRIGGNASAILAATSAPANENCNYGTTSASSINILSIPHSTNFPIASEVITLISTPAGADSVLLCSYIAPDGDSCSFTYTFANGAGPYTIREIITDTSGTTFITDKFFNYQPVSTSCSEQSVPTNDFLVAGFPATVGVYYNNTNNLAPNFYGNSAGLMSYSVSAGRLPNGLSITPANGTGGFNITGVPTEAGYFPFTFKVEIDNSAAAAAILGVSTLNCTGFTFSYNLTVLPGSTGSLSIENHVYEQPSGTELLGTCSPVDSGIGGPLSRANKLSASTILARALAPANENCNYGSTSASSVYIQSTPHTTNFPIASETITVINTPIGSDSTVICSFSAIFDTAVLALGGDSCQANYTFANGAGLYIIRETVTDTSGATFITDKFISYLPAGPAPMFISHLLSPLSNPTGDIFNYPDTITGILVGESNTYQFGLNEFNTEAESNLACTIDWRDGNIDQASVVTGLPASPMNNNNNGSGTHSYSNTGTYLVHVVCDDDLAPANQGVTTHGESFTTIIVEGPADIIDPTITNAMKIDGVPTAGNCSTAGINTTTCDFGTLYTSNLDWSASFNDDSGSLAGLRADLFRPIPLSVVNLAFGAGVSPLPYEVSANLSAYMETTGAYRLAESAADGASNSVNFFKTWNFVNDVDDPTIVNNNYTGPQTVTAALYNVSGVVTDPGAESQTVAVHQDAATVVCGTDPSVFDQTLNSVTNLTVTVTPPTNAGGPAAVPIASNCYKVAWTSNSGSGTLDYDNPVTFTFTQGVTQIGAQTFTVPIYKIRLSIDGSVVTIKFFNQAGLEINDLNVFCGVLAGNAVFAVSGPSACFTGSLFFPAPSSSGIDSVSATLNGNAVSSTNLVLSNPSNGTFAFPVTLAEGLNTIIETVCDYAGRCAEFTKLVTLITDTDGDGVLDPVDECLTTPGTAAFNGCPAGLKVSVQRVRAGNQRSDAALVAKVFDNAAGSCAATLGDMPKNWDIIFNTCIAENTKTETNSPQAGNAPRNFIGDLVGVGVKVGNKLVIVQSQANTDGSHGYAGFKIPNVVAGQTYNVGFERNPGKDAVSNPDGSKGIFVQNAYFTLDSNGIWKSSRIATVISKPAGLGSQVIDAVTEGSLQVFTPEHITWANGTEIYPFLFISEGEWTLDVCLQVPAGYQIVAPGTCDQAFIANEAKVVEFKLAEGSSVSAAAALLSQAVAEPVFGVSLTSKASGSSVAQTSNFKVEGTRSSSKRASDAKLATTIAKFQAEKVAFEKAEAAKVAAVIAQAAQGQAVSAIAQTFKLTVAAGTQHADVLRLQQYLNNKGFTVSATGPGSKGQESSFFGPKTKAALKAFQEAHRAEILAPLGLVNGTGLLGPSTRAFINSGR